MKRIRTRLRAGFGGFSPITLFASGAPGAWYDPSDFSSMYQDSVGTTPVTATGQPVGLLLDKSLGMAIGSELVGVNFTSSTGWTFLQVGTGPAASVGSGALSLPRTDVSNLGEAGFSVSTVAGKSYQVRWTTGAGGIVQIRAGGSVGNATLGAANMAASSSGTFFFTATAASHVVSFVPQTDAATATVTAASVKNIAGSHAIQSTSTARPTLQQDASGFYYLSFDGVDDSLITAATVNFTATQLATVFAGITKSSDAANGNVMTLYNGGVTGTFDVGAPSGTAQATFGVQMGATGVNTGKATGFAAPYSAVLTAAFDLSQAAQASQMSLRVTGVQQTLTLSGVAATPQSGFVNQTMGIGFAVGGTNFFNGRIYGLVVLGRAATANEIASEETVLGRKMGIAL